MEHSPYEPPPQSADMGTFIQPELPRKSGTPKVWPWYVVYCALMALLYLLCLVGGIFMLANSVWLAEQSDEEPLMFVVQGVVFTAFGALLLILYAAAPFLPRRKWAWYHGFATIGIGMTSVCCVPFTIPLLILWIKEDTKNFFGVRSSQNSSQ